MSEPSPVERGTPAVGSPGSEPAQTAQADGADGAQADTAPRHGGIGRRWWAIGIAIAVLVVVVLAPLASSDPDGLERVAEDQGFMERAENVIAGLLGDYAIPGVDNAWLSTVLSGLLGIAIVVIVMVVIGRLVARRRAA